METTKVKIASDESFQLLADHSDLDPALAVGIRADFVSDGPAHEVTE